MSGAAEAREGGCHCGALRYRVTAPSSEAGYCHCRDCQLTSGAPVSVWASFPAAAFAYIAGTPAHYAASARGVRDFCPSCGCQILFRDKDEPDLVHINTPSLDDPNGFPPSHHIFTRSRIAWFEIADDLPRFSGSADEA